MDIIRKRFLWNGNDNESKYHLVKWEKVCQPTDQGGLGIVDLKVMNISLLCKWLWKIENEQGLWQDLILKKYCSRDLLVAVKWKTGQSHIFQSILGVKDFFYRYIRKRVGDGMNTIF